MGVAVLLDQFRVAQHLLVDAKPDLDVGLPRRAHAELRHTRPGRVLELESPHQTDGDLLTRETHQVSKGSDHLSLVQVGTQFGGGASVGERLYFLGFDKRPVQVEDKRADHASSTLQASLALSKTYEYLCTLRLLSQAANVTSGIWPSAHAQWARSHERASCVRRKRSGKDAGTEHSHRTISTFPPPPALSPISRRQSSHAMPLVDHLSLISSIRFTRRRPRAA